MVDWNLFFLLIAYKSFFYFHNPLFVMKIIDCCQIWETSKSFIRICTLCSILPNTAIVINFISCNCHQKEKNYGVFIIVYAALLSIFLTERELLLWLGIYGNCILHSKFYKSEDWENFPKISFWLPTFPPHSHTFIAGCIGHVHATIQPLALHICAVMPGESA